LHGKVLGSKVSSAEVGVRRLGTFELSISAVDKPHFFPVQFKVQKHILKPTRLRQRRTLKAVIGLTRGQKITASNTKGLSYRSAVAQRVISNPGSRRLLES
jgi:hypothetical protein